MTPVGYLVMVGLLWGMDPPDAKVDEFFVLMESVENITGIQRAVVAGTVPAACAQVPGWQTGEYCTQLACPGPGTFRLTIEARPYKTQSNTITLRVKNSNCTQVEGMVLAALPTGIPTAVHCQAPTSRPTTVAPVAVEIPSEETTTTPVATPRDTAPVITPNPDVVPKTPLEPGTATRPPVLAQAPKVPTDTVPPPMTTTVPTGRPTTVMAAQPQPPPTGQACP